MSSSDKSKKQVRYRQNPNKFPRPLRWMLEVDYINKLSPEHQAYLYAFHEAEYGGNGSIMHEDVEEVRRLWRENKRQRSDAMNGAAHDVPIENFGGEGQSPEDVIIETMDAVELAKIKERAKARGEAREAEAKAARKKKKDRLRRLRRVKARG